MLDGLALFWRSSGLIGHVVFDNQHCQFSAVAFVHILRRPEFNRR
jgi:hypothetical protein